MIADLPGFLGERIDRMPWIHRILAENLIRHAPHRSDAADALERWLQAGDGDCEIPFFPARILMHDTTCGPALVDLAAMRDVLAKAGGDSRRINPVLRVDVSTDHSIAVDRYGTRDALAANMAAEMRRNGERYALMKWAGRELDDFHAHPPGTGIMHTINLERLATVVTEAEMDGVRRAFPDTLIGTDSHTPMINGIGVLGWGVGGLEAEGVMLGLPVMLRVPRVIGVQLDGQLPPGVTGTDLALTVTEMLRGFGTGGRFVEFHGPGVAMLTADTRAVVANMAPEFGGATGYFPIDARTIAYLRATGRSEAHAAAVERYARRQRLWHEPDAAPEYDAKLSLDLATVRPSLAGPHRPQDRIALAQAAGALPALPGSPSGLPGRPVALAAITSCTNTSDPRLLIAAGLVARKARALGLQPPGWTKTSLAPGSPAARAYLERGGLLDDLEALGFAITGFGCTVCIGNSGPLAPTMDAAIGKGRVEPVAVISGNRNFPGRVHRQIGDVFLASPPLVVAYAIAGDFAIDLASEAIGTDRDGRPVHLGDIWPGDAEIEAAMFGALRQSDYDTAYALAERNPEWEAMPAPSGDRFAWDPASTYLRPPPFVAAAQESRLGRYAAHPLLVLGDDVTTDHISPAGVIPADSEAADWLIRNGADPGDLNVFSARRGNWEVMLRGLFTNRAVRNLLDPSLEPGETIHAPSNAPMSLGAAAARYHDAGDAVVIVAGERYGMGSSRDWAAKGVALLGVRAILARSFERIHRSNLVNMGILPLLLPADRPPAALTLVPGDRIEIDADPARLVPGTAVRCAIVRRDGGTEAFTAAAAVETGDELETLGAGGMIPRILAREIAKIAPPSLTAR